eukprot:TRINITY_DN1754_c0_g1_i5.p1 TRINITY_DN1754_c0_g1~~TRINITY_DN1754_c0_g1_i5.p1  ORF type:complete len:395 (-),score=44.79 TRINITY_DN1754_c0_g1_i5:28-1212(-)
MKSFVVIVGVGGVGSHVASALGRSGVGHLRVIDFDRVTLSSLNRHAFALREDVGISKVECIRNYLNRVVPHANVEICEEFLTQKNVERLLEGNPDYVVDCIDNIDAKVDLITYCHRNKIKVISCCGAGMKADPTQIQIRDISDSKYDDLARAMRIRLKKNRISRHVTTVFSVERTHRELLPLKEHQEKDPDNFRVLANYRVRIVPVLGTMPALMGYSLSSYVLCDLAGQLYKPHNIDEVKANNYNRMYQLLCSFEKKAGVHENDMHFDVEDIYMLTREVYEWKCVITQKKHQNMEAVKWDPEKPTTVTNIVLMNGEDAAKHKPLQKLGDTYPKEVVERVEGFLKLAAQIAAKNKPQYFQEDTISALNNEIIQLSQWSLSVLIYSDFLNFRFCFS